MEQTIEQGGMVNKKSFQTLHKDITIMLLGPILGGIYWPLETTCALLWSLSEKQDTNFKNHDG